MKREDLVRFVGREVKLNIKIDEKDLFYHGVVQGINIESLTFVDKFGKNMVVKLDNVIKIEDLLPKNSKETFLD